MVALARPASRLVVSLGVQKVSGPASPVDPRVLPANTDALALPASMPTVGTGITLEALALPASMPTVSTGVQQVGRHLSIVTIHPPVVSLVLKSVLVGIQVQKVQTMIWSHK